MVKGKDEAKPWWEEPRTHRMFLSRSQQAAIRRDASILHYALAELLDEMEKAQLFRPFGYVGPLETTLLKGALADAHAALRKVTEEAPASRED